MGETDSISRQEAIKAVSDLYAIYGSEGEWVDRRDVFNALRELPPAAPKPLKYTGESICVYCRTSNCKGCIYEPMTTEEQE